MLISPAGVRNNYCQLTLTDPVIDGCIVHLYVKVPGALNNLLNVSLGLRVPLVNTPGVSLVTLWATTSLFVQVIVVPALTVIVDGVKAIPCMKTSFAPGISDDFEQLFVIMSTEKSKANPVKIPLFDPIIFFIIFCFRLIKHKKPHLVHPRTVNVFLMNMFS